ncbi:MAG: 1,4-alpha-glucan branching enzyme GlgB [Candidatus Binatia bacterium]|nr:MAG: 1,4-alpha-glucan branching enzyme GlgB [Candidatus Binatia bacterium]
MPSTPSLLTEFDLHLLAEGRHERSWEKLGAHPVEFNGERGVYFAVVAPNARRVSVIGEFNGWDPAAHPMRLRPEAGVWELFVPGVPHGALYKYWVESASSDYKVAKADPYAFFAELRPGTASRVWDLGGYAWSDAEWLERRRTTDWLRSPISVYEVHLGSWKRVPEQGNRWLTYRELAEQLPTYVRDMGYTHVEFLPITEHPLDASWGYQTTGYFAPTSRYGTPQDLMYLIDTLHQNGIGVILDWVPAHFPRDEHGLAYFDGTHLYEHADPRLGAHPDWGTLVFNYGRWEVRNFLLSNALFWFEVYHVDGLRVDAVASMLYLDYSRREGEWIPNRYGGRENLEAVEFLRHCNERVYALNPGAVTIAEESTSWPMVSRPTYLGGLGFGFKWDLGWMNDTLRYMGRDPIYRKYHHNDLTFRMLYAFTENFFLPLSHDEVVHGKGSLLGRMPGDDWQKFANLRLLFAYQYTQPGKKLLFMGADFGQWREWDHTSSVDWHLLEHEPHRGVQRLVRDLNRLYRQQAALHDCDCAATGFRWVDCHDSEQSTLSYLRFSEAGETALVVCNFTPVPRTGFRVGVPQGGFWREILNTDSAYYGGSNMGNDGGVLAEPVPSHGFKDSVVLTLPPLAALILVPQNHP